jgi:hypothetical protein
VCLYFAFTGGGAAVSGLLQHGEAVKLEDGEPPSL